MIFLHCGTYDLVTHPQFVYLLFLVVFLKFFLITIFTIKLVICHHKLKMWLTKTPNSSYYREISNRYCRAVKIAYVRIDIWDNRVVLSFIKSKSEPLAVAFHHHEVTACMEQVQTHAPISTARLLSTSIDFTVGYMQTSAQ